VVGRKIREWARLPVKAVHMERVTPLSCREAVCHVLGFTLGGIVIRRESDAVIPEEVTQVIHDELH
jgi:hypothetical protein